MNDFLKDTLKMIIGHCSLNVGWHGIQASSLDLLTDVLEKYIVEIGRSAHRYSEQFGRSEPNLDDVGLAFRELGIFIHDLSEFTTNVEPIPFPYDVCKLPVPKESFLNFLKPGSAEVLTRPVHIHEHLPPMLTDQDVVDANDDLKAAAEFSDLSVTDTSVQEAPTQVPAVKSSLFKRPESTDKLRGLALADEGQPFREIASVMMTTSGYLSSSREGKVAESKLSKSFFEETEAPLERKPSKKSLGIGKRLEESSVTFEKPAVPMPIEKQTEQIERRPPVVAEKEHVTESPITNETLKEKEKTAEKEKAKKKRPKQVMEEFDFFGKDKAKTPGSKPAPVEPKPTSDLAKKLSIFKKTPKSKPVESPIVSLEPKTDYPRPEPPARAPSIQDFISKPTQEVETPKPPEADVDKLSKKEKKLNKKKEKMKIRESMLESEKFRADSPKVDSDFSFGYHQPPVESPLTEIDRDDHSKKKRARISDSLVPEKTFEPEPSIPVSDAGTSKMFFPFPPQFPVSGAIPPPQLFPNVPFNLLGMPLGVRPLLPTAQPPNVPVVSAVRPPPSSQPERTSPSKSPINIVDSLPDSAETFSPVDETSEDPSGHGKKKEKRDKKEKEKKKKDKKNKDRDKDEEKKLKRDKKKEKKDKEKLKMKEKDEAVSSVPKITFKFGAPSTSSSPCPTVESTPKLIFKPMAEREAVQTPSTPKEFSTPTSPASSVSSVEIAKFSALVTRPPKVVKPPKKEPAPERPPEVPSTSTRPCAPPAQSRSPSPMFPRPDKPSKPPKVTKEKDAKKKAEKGGDVAIITETVGSYYDEFGNKIWICPACGRQDDGTPMIGCDECDDWYHWVCVGIRVPPAETESWFCQRCIAKKQGCLKDKKKGRKKKSV